MSTSLSRRDFLVSMYEEHVDEVAFLYVQRRSRMRDPEMPWPAVEEIERRMYAHLDALVVGGALALQVCRERGASEDASQLFAVLSLFCRQAAANDVAVLLNVIDCSQPLVAAAVSEALRQEMPTDWTEFVIEALSRGGRLAVLLADVAASRRMPVGHELLAVLSQQPASERVVNALGLLRVRAAVPALTASLARDKPLPPRVRTAALRALLRLGDHSCLRASQLLAYHESWPRSEIAMGGDWSASAMLRQVVDGDRVDAESVLALGALGEVGAITVLLRLLDRGESDVRPMQINPGDEEDVDASSRDVDDCLELTDAAAHALHWITGAALFEEVMVPEEVDEAELFDDELVAWRERREAPRRKDGNLFGRRVRKLSTSAREWREWIASNFVQIDVALRYRSGRALTPAVLLENVVDAESGWRLRCLASSELDIRYGCPVPFDVRMRVAEQRDAIERMATWVDDRAGRFRAGGWYFAGVQL